MDDVSWDNTTTDYEVLRGGISGQSGYMPPELYLLKSEQTYMYEREDLLDNHFRNTLKDRTLDMPILTQDMPRDSQDMLRSDILNIRHAAARTEAEPIHPDLFLSMTDRDPRGYHNAGPDLKISNTHSSARAKYKDTISDHASDWTIPEGPRSEMRAIRDLRNTINPSKQRLNIFDTSINSRSTPFTGAGKHASHIPMMTSDGQLLDLNDAKGVNYKNDYNGYDKIRIGYRQQGDHRFSVAQYGMAGSKKQRANIYDAYGKNQTSHKFDISPDEVANRLKGKMGDVVKIGYRQIGDNDFSVAKYGRQTTRVTKSDVRESHNNNEYSHEFEDNSHALRNRLSSSIIKEVGRMNNDDKKYMDPVFQDSISLKNTIGQLSYDLSTTRNSTVQTADKPDLGPDIKNIKKVSTFTQLPHDNVIVDKDIFSKINEHKNIAIVRKIDPNFRNNVDTTLDPGTTVQVNIYSRKRPVIIMPLPTNMDHEISEATYEPIYKNNRNRAGVSDLASTEQEQGVNPHADKVFNSFKKASVYHQGLRMVSENINTCGVVNDGISHITN